MSENIPAFRRVKLPTQAGTDGSDGHPLENLILVGLPRSISQKFVQKSQFVTLPVHTVLNEADAPIQQLYFLNSGLRALRNIEPAAANLEIGGQVIHR